MDSFQLEIIKHVSYDEVLHRISNNPPSIDFGDVHNVYLKHGYERYFMQGFPIPQNQ